jgi:hypothetical protein
MSSVDRRRFLYWTVSAAAKGARGKRSCLDKRREVVNGT